MFEVRNTDHGLLNRLFEFAVLSGTFFASCMLFSVDLEGSLLFQMMIYATVIVVFVHLCKAVMVSYKKSLGEVTRQILANAFGILIGTCLVLLVEKLLSTSGGVVVAVIFSSVMAFFILGTLSPVVHKTPIVHK